MLNQMHSLSILWVCLLLIHDVKPVDGLHNVNRELCTALLNYIGHCSAREGRGGGSSGDTAIGSGRSAIIAYV
jgi:hypothetical protein